MKFNKKFIAGGIMILLIIAIPIALLIIRNRQDTRSRASTEAVFLSFSTPNTNLGTNQQFVVDVYLNTNENEVSAVDYTLSFTSSRLILVGFSDEDSRFKNVYENDPSMTATSYRYIGTNPDQQTFSGIEVPLGKFIFKTPNETYNEPQQVTIGVSDLKVAGLGAEAKLDSTFTPATLIISTPPVPTCTPLPSCALPDADPACGLLSEVNYCSCQSSENRPNECQCEIGVQNQCASEYCGEPYVVEDNFDDRTSKTYGTCQNSPESSPSPTPTGIPFDCTGGQNDCICYGNDECTSGYCQKDTPDTENSLGVGICTTPPPTTCESCTAAGATYLCQDPTTSNGPGVQYCSQVDLAAEGAECTRCIPDTTPTQTVAPSQLLCDNDNDTTSDLDDYSVWLSEIRSGNGNESDCDGENGVTIYDYVAWLGEFRRIHGGNP